MKCYFSQTTALSILTASPFGSAAHVNLSDVSDQRCCLYFHRSVEIEFYYSPSENKLRRIVVGIDSRGEDPVRAAAPNRRIASGAPNISARRRMLMI